MELDEFLRISLHAPGGSKERKFYVYTHTDPEGRVFYVGKGQKTRAWDKTSRGNLWLRYIERFDGKYQIDIVKEGLEEDEALWLEEDLMRKFGGQLTNWENLGRNADFKGYERYWELRKVIEHLLVEAKEYEDCNLEKAIEIYRQALEHMKESELLREGELFTGITAELYKTMMAEIRYGNIKILDYLITCLIKLNKHEEVISEINLYIEAFPNVIHKNSFKKIMRKANFKL